MKLCECGCGQEVKNRFVSGHNMKGKKAWNKGIPMTKTAKEKQRLSHWGKVSGNKGKKMSKEARQKMRDNHRDITGDKNPMWKGGKSFEHYPIEWTDLLKVSIRMRDEYICQECGIHQDECNKLLDIHHIDYNKKNCNPDNLITLCRSCHMKTNHDRKKWTKYFKGVMKK